MADPSTQSAMAEPKAHAGKAMMDIDAPLELETKNQKKIDTLLCWLARHPLDQVPRDTTGDVYVWKINNVVVARHDDNLSSVMRKLATENFLSMPVIMNGKFYGIVDMVDMLKFVTSMFSGESEEKWTDFFEKKAEFRNTIVDEVMKSPWFGATRGHDPYHAVNETMSLLHVFEILGRTNLHRVPITKKDELVGIMTRSMCVSMIRQHMYRLGPIRTLRVSEIIPDLRPVCHTINQTDQAVDAFNKMVDKEVSGLAIVDKNGVLKGAISIKDLRGVGPSGSKFARLYRTVAEFKQLVRDEYPKQAPSTHYSNKLVPLAGLYVTPSATLEAVVDLMNDGNIHRVFVCSQESVDAGQPKPIHCISQKDVIAAVLNQVGLPHLD